MEKHSHHEELIRGVAEQFSPILDKSKQAIYIYLDDIHKICNKKFASLLGYNSPKEWAHTKEDILETFVDKNSQKSLVTAYGNAMRNLIASNIEVVWKKRDGKKVKTNVTLVPILFRGHLFALHFIS
ncbi:MAG: hypothetical protein AABX55_01485 [Nanoarchaeota archaeon]